MRGLRGWRSSYPRTPPLGTAKCGTFVTKSWPSFATQSLRCGCPLILGTRRHTLYALARARSQCCGYATIPLRRHSLAGFRRVSMPLSFRGRRSRRPSWIQSNRRRLLRNTSAAFSRLVAPCRRVAFGNSFRTHPGSPSFASSSSFAGSPCTSLETECAFALVSWNARSLFHHDLATRRRKPVSYTHLTLPTNREV
mgnify:CR=1 FL=1